MQPIAVPIPSDLTVPLCLLAGKESESSRTPPTLTHDEIVHRLEEICEFDPGGAGRYFGGVARMNSAHVGSCVIAALEWTQRNRAHPFVASQLEIVALNLKNLE